MLNIGATLLFDVNKDKCFSKKPITYMACNIDVTSTPCEAQQESYKGQNKA